MPVAKECSTKDIAEPLPKECARTDFDKHVAQKVKVYLDEEKKWLELLPCHFCLNYMYVTLIFLFLFMNIKTSLFRVN